MNYILFVLSIIWCIVCLSGCSLAPGRPQCQTSEDKITSCPETPAGVWFLGRSGFWQRSLFVREVRIKSN